MKFLAFGEILWDVFPDGAFLGGAALNFAAHCSLLGVESYIVSAVGADELGERALKELAEYGVHTCFAPKLPHLPTGTCQVGTDERGFPCYRLMEKVAYDAIPVPDASLEDFDLLYFGTLALREEQNRQALGEILKKHRGKVFCDLNIRPPFYSPETVRFALEHAQVIKISDEEMPKVADAVLGGATEPVEDLYRLAQRFSVPQLFLLTCGGDGAKALVRGGEMVSCDAVKAKVVSTVGAGDSFSAAFLTHYLAGAELSKAMAEAAKLAAFVVSRTEAVPR